LKNQTWDAQSRRAIDISGGRVASPAKALGPIFSSGIPVIENKGFNRWRGIPANQDSIRPFIGKHVTVNGTMQNGELTVAGVKLAKGEKK